MKTCSVVLFVLFLTNSLFAQEVEFLVQPAANRVGTQDAFEVKYVLKNAQRAQSFSLTQLNDFQVLDGPSRSNSIMDVNGVRTVSIELTYVLKAKRKGKLNLPQGVMSMDGREYTTLQRAVEVVEGSVRTAQTRRSGNPFDDPFFSQDPFDDDIFASMQRQHQQMLQMLQRQSGRGGIVQGGQAPGQRQVPATQSGHSQTEFTKENLSSNLFIKVDVDKKNVVLGQQLTASYKLYTRLPMEINLTKLPSLNGFWNQDFKLPKIPRPVREIVNGKEFQVFEIKRTALFPTQTGILELDPAEAEGIARILKPKKIRQENPFGDDPFFRGFFGSMLMSDPAFSDQYATVYDYEDVKVNLKSTAIKINVTDIPDQNKPVSYKGAIGAFQIESNIDRTEMTTDDAATITLKVSGSGNLKLIGAPDIRFPADIDVFENKEMDTIVNTNDIIAGYKIFQYTFSSAVPGTFTIPSAEFSWYDPESREYKTQSTPSYTLEVKPGKGDDKSIAQKLPTDIHDIRTGHQIAKASRKYNLPSSPLFWGGFAVPAIAFIGLMAFKRKEDRLQQDVVLFKNKRANKIALKRLETAERYLKLSAQNAFYEETSKAVWLYLSDKMAIPLSHLSKEVAAEKLLQRNVPQNLQEELFRVTQECETALYAPESGTMRMHQTYNDAYRLIGKLEDFLSA